jgi:SAM-dependent methyltransferase
MSDTDRRRWQEKHRHEHSAFARESLRWLRSTKHPRADRTPPLALDLACGQGRHCTPLLDLGYCVVAADIARNALERVRSRIPTSTAGLHVVQIDLEEWVFAPSVFDLIVQIDFLDRRRFTDIKASTRRGGHVLVDTFMRGVTGNAKGPRSPDYLLVDGELERVFADWRILELETASGDTARAAILAQRP